MNLFLFLFLVEEIQLPKFCMYTWWLDSFFEGKFSLFMVSVPGCLITWVIHYVRYSEYASSVLDGKFTRKSCLFFRGFLYVFACRKWCFFCSSFIYWFVICRWGQRTWYCWHANTLTNLALSLVEHLFAPTCEQDIWSWGFWKSSRTSEIFEIGHHSKGTTISFSNSL